MAQLASNTLTPSTALSPGYKSRTPSRSRSPHRSPERNAQSSTHPPDPLLSNLSPESTLEALSAVDAVRAANGPAQNALAETIANASPADRGFGVRAALAGQNLKQWYKELRSWQWPDKRDAGLGKGFLPPADGDSNPSAYVVAGKPYLGSLHSELALQYESRIEEIKDSMDTLGLDELKEHVLDQHVASRSRPVSASSTMSNIDAPLSYSQLSDFSALVTATILHALPVLSRLSMLLERWSVRMKVLRLIPGLLSGLSKTHTAVRLALDRINKGMLPDTDDQWFSRESFAAARSKLEANVSLVGAQMDNVLDTLEGREDSLPEPWIDEIDAIEAEFATWVSQAEKKALGNEWLARLKEDGNNESVETPDPVSKNEEQETTRPVSSAQSLTEHNNTIPAMNHDPADAAMQANNVCQHHPATDEHGLRPTQESVANMQSERSSPIQSNEYDKSSDMPALADPPDTDIEDNNETSTLLLASEMDDSISSVSSVQHHLGQEEGGSCLYSGERKDNQPPSEDEPQAEHDCIQSTPVKSEDKSRAEIGAETADTTNDQDLNASPLATPHISIESPKKRVLEIDSEKVPDASVGASPAMVAGSEQHRDDSNTVEPTRAPADRSPEMKVAKILNFGFSPKRSREGFPNDYSESTHQETREIPDTRNNQPDSSRPRLSRTTSLPSKQAVKKIGFSEDDDENQNSETFNLKEGEHTSWQSAEGFPKSKLRSTVLGQSDSLKSRRAGRPKPLLLRRSFSSADLTTVQPFGGSDLRTAYEDTDVDEGQSSPSKHCDSSPSTSPDLPPSSVSPIKPRKRAKVSNHTASESNVSTPKALQSRGLRPSPVITSTRPTAKPAPASASKSCGDHLDQKINALLTTLPGRIHLASASEGSTNATESSSLRRTSRNERVKSESPAASRSSTPTQPITLTPAVSRSRRSLGPPDESVKLYHLHRGGKSAPVKLFVRSVGEDGERVMVRVGGGWADLGEYLKEYVVHHGRRKVSEEQQFDIKGIPFKGSSSSSSLHNYSSGRLTPTPSNGRTTPAPRPGSAFDVRRPSSSLSVRKTRRLSGEPGMETPAFTGANTQVSSEHPIDESETPPRRRLSVQSSVSADDPHTPPSGSRSSSTPLGLAGPKPRSRQVSMSPESEAWVEGVMGEARKKTGTLKHQYSSGTLRSLPPVAEDEVKANSKVRSASDIGGGSLGRRGYLRVLNK